MALVTGANHGIGAATARSLASHGAGVLITYLRLDDDPDPGTPAEYAAGRARHATAVVELIRSDGGRAEAIEADLSDEASISLLFDAAERSLGPVEILINNASGWVPDTFSPASGDRLGRNLRPVSAASFDKVFAVDARAAALLIAEFARRHVARGASWGRISRADLRRPSRFPRGGVVRGGQGRPGELHDVGRVRVGRLRRHRQRGLPAGHRHRMGNPRRRGLRRSRRRPLPCRTNPKRWQRSSPSSLPISPASSPPT